MSDQYAQWAARPVRSLGQVPARIPLVWKAARLYAHTWRMARHRSRHRDAGHVEDALAVLALSTSIYHDTHWYGVLQAARAGATNAEIAMALGISIDNAQDLVHRIAKRDRELGQHARPEGDKGRH
ncbi:hypothetical protein [Streptomyces lydicus]|uniref:hypothetical protein n=1 Tax=Streptomyces lydicus TaxID=47763 RepID=UPI0010105873|nr:hypothetical protein [Streptomyces lydicus]MCZ1012636.1 hypothetical protein [Streptomyces lydicus]